MSLPQRLPLELMQTQWSAQLNPLVANVLTQGILISSVELISGVDKTISTGLNRPQQGWFLTDQSAGAVVWRTQPFNSDYLVLQSSANVTISLWVF